MRTAYIIDPRYGHGHYGRLPAPLADFLVWVGNRFGACLDTVTAADSGCGDCGQATGRFGASYRCDGRRSAVEV